MPLVDHMETPESRLFGALAVRYSPDATLLLTVDGTILMAAAAATALFGYSSEELASGGQGLLMDRAMTRRRQGCRPGAWNTARRTVKSGASAGTAAVSRGN